MQLHLPPVLEKLAALEAQVLVVSFATLPHLQKWQPYFENDFLKAYYEEHNLTRPDQPFARTRFVADPERKVYKAYGLGRNSVFKVYGPAILGQYARWAIQGKPIKKPTEDVLQRGGDFVIGRDSCLSLAYVGRDQSDRPPIATILTALARG